MTASLRLEKVRSIDGCHHQGLRWCQGPSCKKRRCATLVRTPNSVPLHEVPGRRCRARVEAFAGSPGTAESLLPTAEPDVGALVRVEGDRPVVFRARPVAAVVV